MSLQLKMDRKKGKKYFFFLHSIENKPIHEILHYKVFGSTKIIEKITTELFEKKIKSAAVCLI